jgi:hypothetical protein
MMVHVYNRQVGKGYEEGKQYLLFTYVLCQHISCELSFTIKQSCQ